jgi:hypothetical protein
MCLCCSTAFADVAIIVFINLLKKFIDCFILVMNLRTVIGAYRLPFSGIEASAAANLNGAPGIERALSLLSDNSADAASVQPILPVHPGLATIGSSSNPVVQGSSGLWQEGTGFDHEARLQALDPLSNGGGIAAPHQLHLLKVPSYDSSPCHYDQMN